jgi:hypothetical protein
MSVVGSFMLPDTPSDRRTYLKYAGVAAVAALAGCSGGNGDEPEPNHEVPHPNDGSLSNAEATGTAFEGEDRDPDLVQAKDADTVNFQHVPNGDQYCGNCEEFVTDKNDDGFGACLLVDGKIHPCDWCALYEGPYEGDDAVACSM